MESEPNVIHKIPVSFLTWISLHWSSGSPITPMGYVLFCLIRIDLAAQK